MYILELTRGFPLAKQPMLGCFEYDQAKAIAQSGHKVVLLAIDLRSILRRRKYGLSIFEKDGIIVYNFAFPVGNVPNYILAFFTCFFAKLLYKEVVKNQGKPDLIHAHFCFIQGYAGARLKKKYGIPLVITEHSSELINKFDESRYKYYSYAYNNANTVVSVGTGLQKAIKSRFNRESVVIPNIVDLSIFSYFQKSVSDNFMFVSVGSLLCGKGFDVLLKAFAQLNDNSNRLTIIGDGPEKNKLEDLAKELEIDKQVTFTGFLPRSRIVSFINQSQVFILTSRYETFGVVYIEALATGTPVIATRCGGPEDIVTKGNGLLVDVDNIEETVDAMKTIKKNYKNYDFKQIAKDINIYYSSETIGKLLIKVFKNIV